jgi:hypothetical protein
MRSPSTTAAWVPPRQHLRHQHVAPLLEQAEQHRSLPPRYERPPPREDAPRDFQGGEHLIAGVGFVGGGRGGALFPLIHPRPPRPRPRPHRSRRRASGLGCQCVPMITSMVWLRAPPLTLDPARACCCSLFNCSSFLCCERRTRSRLVSLVPLSTVREVSLRAGLDGAFERLRWRCARPGGGDTTSRRGDELEPAGDVDAPDLRSKREYYAAQIQWGDVVCSSFCNCFSQAITLRVPSPDTVVTPRLTPLFAWLSVCRPARYSTRRFGETRQVSTLVFILLALGLDSNPLDRRLHIPSDGAIAPGAGQRGARRRQARASSGGSLGSCHSSRERGREPGRRLDHADSGPRAALLCARSRDLEAEGMRGRQGGAVEPGLPVNVESGRGCRDASGHGRQIGTGGCRVRTLHCTVSGRSQDCGEIEVCQCDNAVTIFYENLRCQP